MVVTKRYVRNLSEKSFLNISEDMENIILEKFWEKPKPDENGHIYEYSEQDVFEQIRKMF